jgi:hypothetical protein
MSVERGRERLKGKVLFHDRWQDFIKLSNEEKGRLKQRKHILTRL